jgi:hypothetical protein
VDPLVAVGLVVLLGDLVASEGKHSLAYPP